LAQFITFLTDFGLADDFVGTCHGVIRRIAPEAHIIDITHGIPAQQVLQGSLVLANTIPYMPSGVHLAVVDPGVGSDRRAVVLTDRSGRVYIGPDNGLLIPTTDRMGGVAEVHEIANPAYSLQPISKTFHGRDVFAPAAAHISNGVSPSELGPPVDPADLMRLDIPEPEVGSKRIRATILYIDHFGNVQLNLRRDELERVGIEPGADLEFEHRSYRYYAVAARTFTDARRGDIILYEDAYRNVSVAISGGDAATMLKARPGDELRIAFRE
jgi:S-adenosyl-L-methionine hydrolase (adenosine-forming)